MILNVPQKGTPSSSTADDQQNWNCIQIFLTNLLFRYLKSFFLTKKMISFMKNILGFINVSIPTKIQNNES